MCHCISEVCVCVFEFISRRVLVCVSVRAGGEYLYVHVCSIYSYLLQVVQNLSLYKVSVHDAGGVSGRRAVDHPQRQVGHL